MLSLLAASSALKSILPKASLSAGVPEFLKSSSIGPTFASASVLSNFKTVALLLLTTCKGKLVPDPVPMPTFPVVVTF